MKKFAIAITAALLVCVSGALAVNLMSELSDAGTVTKDESVIPQSGTDRRGLYVIHYEVPAAGITGAVDLVDWEIPKGMILLEDAVIEVQTAVLPATSITAIDVGGVAILGAGTTLNATGIDAAVWMPGITTADDKPYITVTGDSATSGVFTIYLPVVAGNAQ